MVAVSETGCTDAAGGRCLARLTAVENVQVVASACETTGRVGGGLCTLRLDVRGRVVVEQKRNDLVNTVGLYWECHEVFGQWTYRGHWKNTKSFIEAWSSKPNLRFSFFFQSAAWLVFRIIDT